MIEKGIAFIRSKQSFAKLGTRFLSSPSGRDLLSEQCRELILQRRGEGQKCLHGSLSGEVERFDGRRKSMVYEIVQDFKKYFSFLLVHCPGRPNAQISTEYISAIWLAANEQQTPLFAMLLTSYKTNGMRMRSYLAQEAMGMFSFKSLERNLPFPKHSCC